MMRQLKTVLRSYLQRPLLWFGCALYASQMVGFLGGTGSARIQPMLLMLIAFGCGWPAATVGFHVKQQFADPRAALTPGFRGPHVVALLIVTAAFVLPLPLIAWLSGHSFVGLTATCATYYTLVFSWAVIQRGAWSALLMVAVFAPYTAGARDLFEFLANGRNDGLAAAAIAASVAVFATALRRLVRMTEDDPSYRCQFRTNMWDLNARATRKAMSDYYSTRNTEGGFWVWLAGAGLPERARYVGGSRLGRLRHWLKGWPNARGTMITAVVMLPLLLWWMRSGMEGGGRSALVGQFWVFITFPQATLLSLFQFRASSMGWESLRPLSRREYVQEMGLVGLFVTLCTWAAAITALLVVSAVSGFELVDVRTWFAFALVTGSLQIPAFAVMTRALATRRLWPAYVWLIVVSAVGMLPAFLALHKNGVSTGVRLAVALLLAGGVLLRRSYQFWCNAELG